MKCIYWRTPGKFQTDQVAPTAMKPVEVSEIRINEFGELFVKPSVNPDNVCRFVYRAAMEVDWDEESQSFICPAPREWSYLDWYKQVLAAAVSEPGILLKVTNTTAWINIPRELQEQISSYVYFAQERINCFSQNRLGVFLQPRYVPQSPKHASTLWPLKNVITLPDFKCRENS
jgi:hypothetical protein